MEDLVPTTMEVDIISPSGGTVRTRRPIAGFSPHTDISAGECSYRMPAPCLYEGEELHYVIGSFVPLIVQKGR